MMFLTDLTLTICVLSLICTALMMLVPDRFRREIRSVIALIAAVTVCAMLLGVDISDISSELGTLSFNKDLATHDRLVQDELEGRISEYIASFLLEDGIECKKVEVRTTIDEQRRISITEASLELDDRDRDRESKARSLIREKIGEIDVKISYEES